MTTIFGESRDPGVFVVPTIEGIVRIGSAPASGAYVQLRDRGDDFVGEVSAGVEGGFRFYAVPGTWRLVALHPGPGGSLRAEHDVELAQDDLEVDIELG
jgi:hypothetical protein